ncbi:MAG: Crp/Fnr family transcriptional regulator [Flavobacteriia bacterium]|nr:Crp/Fnr family transcriptional regulator [Flavobacteriia bacterium]
MLLSNYCSPSWCSYAEFYSKRLQFKKDCIIFSVGQKTEGIFIITSGFVKITKKTNDNEERIIRLAKKDDFVGHRGFGGNWTYTVTANALSDVEVLFLPLQIYTDLVVSNPNFAVFMLDFFANELRESEHLANQLPIRNKIAWVLIKTLETFGWDENSSALNYTLSRKDLASMAGTRYETLIRTLAEFNKEKLIENIGKNIHILNLPQLQKEAGI